MQSSFGSTSGTGCNAKQRDDYTDNMHMLRCWMVDGMAVDMYRIPVHKVAQVIRTRTVFLQYSTGMFMLVVWLWTVNGGLDWTVEDLHREVRVDGVDGVVREVQLRLLELAHAVDALAQAALAVDHDARPVLAGRAPEQQEQRVRERAEVRVPRQLVLVRVLDRQLAEQLRAPKQNRLYSYGISHTAT